MSTAAAHSWSRRAAFSLRVCRLVIDDTGNKTYRQAKMHSAGPDGQTGAWLDTFKVAKNVSLRYFLIGWNARVAPTC